MNAKIVLGRFIRTSASKQHIHLMLNAEREGVRLKKKHLKKVTISPPNWQKGFLLSEEEKS